MSWNIIIIITIVIVIIIIILLLLLFDKKTLQFNGTVNFFLSCAILFHKSFATCFLSSF